MASLYTICARQTLAEGLNKCKFPMTHSSFVEPIPNYYMYMYISQITGIDLHDCIAKISLVRNYIFLAFTHFLTDFIWIGSVINLVFLGLIIFLMTSHRLSTCGRDYANNKVSLSDDRYE